VVSKGLSELYKVQPKNPITFLANWLLNESRSKKIYEGIDDHNRKKKELKEKYEKITKENEEKLNIEEEKNKETSIVKNDFVKMIRDDIDEILNNICDGLKRIINATGVYISIKDKKRKKVNENDDENAHLEDVEVIRYVAWDKDHQFLKGLFLDLDSGITNDLFKPKEEENKNEGQGNNANQMIDEEIKKKEEEKSNFIYEKEVVRNPRMKYFKEPRLGCYLAVDLTYKSSLSKTSLDSSIAMKEDFEKRKIEAEDKEKQAEEDYNRKLEEIKNNEAGGGGDGNTQQPELPQKPEKEIVVENDFEKKEKKYILSIDTLGQDREFEENEKIFIFEIVKRLRERWEDREKNILLKDREIRLEMKRSEKSYLEINPKDKYQDIEDKFIKDYLTETFGDNQPTDTFKLMQENFARSRLILKTIMEDENLKKLVLSFNQMDVIEYEIVFQNILYFIGIDNKEINEEETNKLFWKKSRKFWKMDVLEKLKKYHPFGPKGKVPSFAMINRLLPIFENENNKKIEENYSFALQKLNDFMVILLNIRKEDILFRRKKIDELNKQREIFEEQEKKRQDDCKKMLEDAEKDYEAKEEKEGPFNPDLLIEDFNKNNPQFIIPEKAEYDKDEDILLLEENK